MLLALDGHRVRVLERDPVRPAGSWRYERIEAAGRWLRHDAPDRVSRLLPDFPGSVPADAAAAAVPQAG